jgi:hypothetical protein
MKKLISQINVVVAPWNPKQTKKLILP